MLRRRGQGHAAAQPAQHLQDKAVAEAHLPAAARWRPAPAVAVARGGSADAGVEAHATARSSLADRYLALTASEVRASTGRPSARQRSPALVPPYRSCSRLTTAPEGSTSMSTSCSGRPWPRSFSSPPIRRRGWRPSRPAATSNARRPAQFWRARAAVVDSGADVHRAKAVLSIARTTGRADRPAAPRCRVSGPQQGSLGSLSGTLQLVRRQRLPAQYVGVGHAGERVKVMLAFGSPPVRGSASWSADQYTPTRPARPRPTSWRALALELAPRDIVVEQLVDPGSPARTLLKLDPMKRLRRHGADRRAGAPPRSPSHHSKKPCQGMIGGVIDELDRPAPDDSNSARSPPATSSRCITKASDRRPAEFVAQGDRPNKAAE